MMVTLEKENIHPKSLCIFSHTIAQTDYLCKADEWSMKSSKIDHEKNLISKGCICLF